MAGELLRVTVVDGELVLDLRLRIGGRGAWLHADLDCLAKAERRRAFVRALRVSGPLDVTAVRGRLRELTSTTTPGSSRVSQEEGKQVGPS